MGGFRFIFSHTVQCLWHVSVVPQTPSFIILLMSECQSTRGNVDVPVAHVGRSPICVVLVIYFVCVLVSPYQNEALVFEFVQEIYRD